MDTSIFIASLITIIFAAITIWQYFSHKNNISHLSKEQINERFADKRFNFLRIYWSKNGWLVLLVLTILFIITTIKMAV